MPTCYTVGYDSLVPGIIANLNPTRDAIIVGKNGRGRLVFLSPDDSPEIKDGRIETAFCVADRYEGNPLVALAASPGTLDEPTLLVMIDTSRGADHDDGSEAIGVLAGAPHPVAVTESQMSGFLSVQGLYVLSAGDVICMRPLGVSGSDWTHQRVISCERGDEGLELKVMSRHQYHHSHKAHGLARGTRLAAPADSFAESTA